jgi:DNA-3-methyladenine glycosylase II
MQPIRDERDIELAIAGLLAVVPEFAGIVDKSLPIPLRHQPPGYRGLASIVISQMVSRASADAIWSRLEALAGEVSVEAISALTEQQLRAAGLSGAKASTLHRLAEACRDGLDLEKTAFLPAEEALAALTSVKGIGPWSAEVFLLFSAGHPDIFPAGDVALLSAYTHAFGLESRPAAKTFRVLAERWQPYRSIAARVLWAYYARQMRRNGLPVA